MVIIVKIIINSSPIIFLVRLRFLELFLEISDEIYLPSSVLQEISAKSDEINSAIIPLINTQKLLVKATNLGSLFNHLNLSLGLGESETIALATELQADLVILDDLAARKAASNLGLNVKGTLGIIKKLTKAGQIEITDLNEFYLKLLKINFRISRLIFDTIFSDL